LWQNTDGQVALWSIDGGLIDSEAYPGAADDSWRIRGTGDFDGDGHDDILWQQTTGQVAIWHMSRGSRLGEAYPGGKVAANWSIQGIGDFDGDESSDILWRDDTGQLAIWFRGQLADPLPQRSTLVTPALPHPSIRPGRSKVSATSTGTAGPTFCGGTPTGRWRSGTWRAVSESVRRIPAAPFRRSSG
jgi:hypothetical protein